MVRYRMEIAGSIILSLIIFFSSLWFTPILSRNTVVGIEYIFYTVDFQYIQRVSPGVVGLLFYGDRTEVDGEYDSIYVMDTDNGKFLVWEGRLSAKAGKQLFAGAVLGTQDRCIRLNGFEPSWETQEQDFPQLDHEDDYPFEILNEAEGYLLRTSLPVIDCTESVAEIDLYAEPCFNYISSGILLILFQYEMLFLISVTLLQRRRRYHRGLTEVFDQTRWQYGRERCHTGEATYAKYVQTCLDSRLFISLITGIFHLVWFNSDLHWAIILCAYLCAVGTACGLAVRAKCQLYRQPPAGLICCLTSVDQAQVRRYLLGVMGIGRFEEMRSLACAFFLEGQPVQAWRVLDTAWHTMDYKTPASKLKARLLRCLLTSFWAPEQLERQLPMLLRICRITPLTLFFAVGQGKMSVKAVKLCLQAFCTRRWEDVLRLTDQFAQKKRAATPSLWIWVMRYQAAAACGQWNTAQDALNALACFPHLTEWLNAAWTAGPQPIKRP